jgi:diguanylate cyclase (GGDEF)-like protein
MTDEEKSKKGFSRRSFLGRAAAAPVVLAPGGGIAAQAAGTAAKRGLSVGLGVKLSGFLQSLARDCYRKNLGIGAQVDQIRQNILGRGGWSVRQADPDRPRDWLDGKVDFRIQNSMLSRLKSMPAEGTVKDLLSDESLADIYENSGLSGKDIALELRDLLNPVCGDETTADDLVRSFHGFFEKLAHHAVESPGDFEIYGQYDGGWRPQTPEHVSLVENDLERLIDILKDYENRYGIKSPVMESLQKANEKAIAKAKQEWFEIINDRHDQHEAAQREKEKAQDEKAREFMRKQDEEIKARQEEKLHEPSKRGKCAVTLKYEGEDRFEVVSDLPTTQVDWHQWALSANPQARPHHVRLSDDSRTVTIKHVADNAAVLRQLFQHAHSDGTFTAHLPNRRTGIDLTQQNNQAFPNPLPYSSPKTSLTLNIERTTVKAQDIIDGGSVLGIDFSRAAGNTTDPLTGLNNIAGIRAELQKHRRRNEGAENDSVILVRFDIERFKALNDQYGYEQGDIILQELAQRIKNSTEYMSILGRTDGDEMVAIYYGDRKSEEDILSGIEQSMKKKAPIILTNAQNQLEPIDIRLQRQENSAAQVINFSPPSTVQPISAPRLAA